MDTSKVLPLVAAGLAACAAMPWAQAQSAPAAPPPPQMERLEEGVPPASVIPESRTPQVITETRDRGGRVNEVQVTRGNSTYYLKPHDPIGSGAQMGDTQSQTTRGAQWRLFEFDWGRRQEGRPPVLDAPPPPPMPAETR